uniref:Uncharacterized protein n=1 Tax=Utricularia reniformis TaxID=192314 RepID=A0A1Y0B065_9LAMI|nr:hypothetical protein AEK19_MT0523 [Utricularia reniformis]ART30779.1 hypothetical protein AEK19_MT0523 [Utricularia reniformis]
MTCVSALLFYNHGLNYNIQRHMGYYIAPGCYTCYSKLNTTLVGSIYYLIVLLLVCHIKLTKTMKL